MTAKTETKTDVTRAAATSPDIRRFHVNFRKPTLSICAAHQGDKVA
jgi:hypothetical protein